MDVYEADGKLILTSEGETGESERLAALLGSLIISGAILLLFAISLDCSLADFANVASVMCGVVAVVGIIVPRFAAMRGTWTLDNEGVMFVSARRQRRSAIRWVDLQRVRWVKRGAELDDGKRILAIRWQRPILHWQTDDVPRFLSNILSTSFDLRVPDGEILPRRFSASRLLACLGRIISLSTLLVILLTIGKLILLLPVPLWGPLYPSLMFVLISILFRTSYRIDPFPWGYWRSRIEPASAEHSRLLAKVY